MVTKESSSAETLDLRFGVLADQHERRRRGLPTVTTLVGPVATAERLWQVWASRCGRPWVMTTGGTRRQWLEHWLAAVLVERDLFVEAERYLVARCARLRQSASQRSLRHKTLLEIETILEQAQLSDYGLDPDRLCAWLLRRRAKSEPLSIDDLIRQQSRWCELSAFSIEHAFRQVVRLLKPEATPALLLIGHDSTSATNDPTDARSRVCELHELAEELARLATCAHELTLGLAVDEPLWHAYLQQAPDSFAKAVVRENAISLDDLRFEPSLPYSTCSAGPYRHDTAACESAASPVVLSLGEDPTACSMLMPTVHLTDSLGAHEPVVDSLVDEPWNSEYERFLFEYLEKCSDLRGLFELNVDGGFDFGNKPIEIDLACRELKIAIEIDGFFHFLNPDCYRRDRRKDLVLQRHGYVVIRFLTNDVVEKMPKVLRTIREEVRFRQAQIQSYSQT